MNLGILFNTDRLGPEELCDYAQNAEKLGFESVWLPELFTRDPFSTAGFLLSQTQSLKLATGIANVYARDPVATISSASSLQELSSGRFILGLGVSNAGLNKARGHEWQKPLGKLSSYLAAMAEVKLTSPQLTAPTHVAAHGPKMLAIAANQADGANTYLMPLKHVSYARKILGEKAELNTMLFCLLETDPVIARNVARKAIAYYVNLDYYHRAWREFDLNDADFLNGGSDHLIDSVVAWGTQEQINQRVARQFEHGASRVVVIPIGSKTKGHPDWELLNALQTQNQ